MWYSAEHTDEENLRWCWLRAVEWRAWPAFLSQLVAPVMFVFFPWYLVIAAVVGANLVWSLFRYRFVNVAAADFAVVAVVFLKWVVCVAAAIYLFTHGQRVAAMVALFWPLIAGLLPFPPMQVGVVQKMFMEALGYTRKSNSGEDQANPSTPPVETIRKPRRLRRARQPRSLPDDIDSVAYVQETTGGDPDNAVAVLIALVHASEEGEAAGNGAITVRQDILEELIRLAKQTKRPIINKKVAAMLGREE